MTDTLSALLHGNRRLEILPDEMSCIDDYTTRLNETCPSVERVMGNRIEDIARFINIHKDYFLSGISPDQLKESACLINILNRSARNRLWQPSITALNTLTDSLPPNVVDMRLHNYFSDVIDTERAGYTSGAKVHVHEGGCYLLVFPTQKLMDHFAGKCAA